MGFKCSFKVEFECKPSEILLVVDNLAVSLVITNSDRLFSKVVGNY